MTQPPRDNEAHRFPVAVKGVLIRDGKVILCRNERDEWELPGGKLELSESPEECLTREIAEELQIAVEPESILDSWVYTIATGVHVIVIAYGCVESSRDEAVVSDEHKELRWFPVADIDTLRLPDGYKASIRSWSARLAVAGQPVR
jgi:8-oxo-dGTP pyrophosphatase MutT (NUDIX family)